MDESKKVRSNGQKWNKWSVAADGVGWKYNYLRDVQGRVIDMVKVSQDVNFLDIGCGTGRAVWLAAEKAGFMGDYYGVDISEKMVEKSGQNFRGHDNFHFIRASSESIPLQDNYFDTIICTNSFHHYLHPEKAMSEISRLLKPGGRIFILDPVADNWLVKLIDLIFRLFESAHIKFYSSEEFRNFMSESGLRYAGVTSLNILHKVEIGVK
jgi:ubiquinone/menaquinone biosynthesis C-methylase UbiE